MFFCECKVHGQRLFTQLFEAPFLAVKNGFDKSVVYLGVHIFEYCLGMTLSSTVQHVGTRDLRANLAHYLRAATNGHTIFITLDGLPVAQLSPIGQQANQTSLEALIASGLVLAPSNDEREMSAAAFELPAGLSSDRALREIRGR